MHQSRGRTDRNGAAYILAAGELALHEPHEARLACPPLTEDADREQPSRLEPYPGQYLRVSIEP